MPGLEVKMSYKVGDIVVWQGEDGYSSRWRLVSGKGDVWKGSYVGGPKTKMKLELGDIWDLVPLTDSQWADEFEVFVRQTREEANCS
jgi:hypothetical protein